VIHKERYGVREDRELDYVGEDRSNNKAKGLDRVRGQNSLEKPHFKTDSKSESKFALI
jgi:hypothetical protein